MHAESSRSHAILDLELVTKAVVDARNFVLQRESELTPVMCVFSFFLYDLIQKKKRQAKSKKREMGMFFALKKSAHLHKKKNINKMK